MPEKDDRNPQDIEKQQPAAEGGSTPAVAKSRENLGKKKPRGRPFKKGEGGRPRGVKNKVTRSMVEDVLQAYQDKGGVEYLKTLGPDLFVAMLKRLVPNETKAEVRAAVDLTVAMREMSEEELDRLARIVGNEGGEE